MWDCPHFGQVPPLVDLSMFLWFIVIVIIIYCRTDVEPDKMFARIHIFELNVEYPRNHSNCSHTYLTSSFLMWDCLHFGQVPHGVDLSMFLVFIVTFSLFTVTQMLSLTRSFRELTCLIIVEYPMKPIMTQLIGLSEILFHSEALPMFNKIRDCIPEEIRTYIVDYRVWHWFSSSHVSCVNSG